MFGPYKALNKNEFKILYKSNVKCVHFKYSRKTAMKFNIQWMHKSFLHTGTLIFIRTFFLHCKLAGNRPLPKKISLNGPLAANRPYLSTSSKFLFNIKISNPIKHPHIFHIRQDWRILRTCTNIRNTSFPLEPVKVNKRPSIPLYIRLVSKSRVTPYHSSSTHAPE